MKAEGASRRRGSIVAAAALAAAATLAAVFATREVVARGALVALVLILSWRLFAAVRKGLGEQRAGGLEAPSRGELRGTVAASELLRIRAEVGRARESREQFDKGLGRRLRSLAERRGVPEAAGSGGAGAKGPSLAELEKIVDALEES